MQSECTSGQSAHSPKTSVDSNKRSNEYNHKLMNIIITGYLLACIPCPRDENPAWVDDNKLSYTVYRNLTPSVLAVTPIPLLLPAFSLSPSTHTHSIIVLLPSIRRHIWLVANHLHTYCSIARCTYIGGHVEQEVEIKQETNTTMQSRCWWCLTWNDN